MSNENHPEIIYEVTISEIAWDDFEEKTPIYKQIVEQLDIKAVIDAVNSSGNTPIKLRATRSDKGKTRVPIPVPAAE